MLESPTTFVTMNIKYPFRHADTNASLRWKMTCYRHINGQQQTFLFRAKRGFYSRYPSSLCGFSRLFLIYALLYQSFTNCLASPAHFLTRFPCTGYPSVATPPLAFLNSIYPCVSNFASELKLASPLSSLLPLSYSF